MKKKKILILFEHQQNKRVQLTTFRNLSHTLCEIPDGVVLLLHLFLDFEITCNFIIPTCRRV